MDQVIAAFSARTQFYTTMLRVFAMIALLIAASQQVRWLGEGMWVVDAGDYDRDGKSEILKSTRFEYSYP
jgi:hypothetical protein